MTELRTILHAYKFDDITAAEAERQILAALAESDGRYPVTVGNGSFTATIYEIPARGGIVEPYDVRPRGVGSDGQ